MNTASIKSIVHDSNPKTVGVEWVVYIVSNTVSFKSFFDWDIDDRHELFAKWNVIIG